SAELAEHLGHRGRLAEARTQVILALLRLRRPLEAHPHLVRDWIFGAATNDYAVTRAGFEPWVALAAILVIALLAVTFAWNRYRRLS
ncbi:MAG: hypothetical protein RI637_13290, partial [Acidimicrobiia bacterium]|nr:hypothetical protein [Acidimicrobiia bacterium]